MASITGIVSPNPVQENTNGSPITLNNVAKDDFFVIIAAAGGTEMRPNITLSGVPVETLADTTATPRYQEWRQACYWYWWGWPWWRYYWPWYYWNGYCHWYWAWYYGYCGYYYCYQYTVAHVAQARVIWARAQADGVLTATASLANGNISRFTVYHFRCQLQSAPGKVIDKVSWVLRTPQTVGQGQNTWSQRAAANDFMLVVAVGNSGPTIAATPSGGTVTNLVNYIFTHGPYVQILVRLDWVNSSNAISYQFTRADVSQFIAGYSVDLRERYADFPSTGSVYWVVAPVRVNSNLQYVYPKPLEQAIVTAAALDPVSYGIEFTFPRGNLQYSEDQFGQINVSSYEELHIIRLPSSVQISSSVGDILLTDSELEAYITGLMRGWIA
jgi:hypothetical protein